MGVWKTSPTSTLPAVKDQRGFLHLALPPVLVQVDAEHQQEDEDDDPLWDVRELAAVDRETGHVTTVAGNGSNDDFREGILATEARLFGPQAVAVDSPEAAAADNRAEAVADNPEAAAADIRAGAL